MHTLFVYGLWRFGVWFKKYKGSMDSQICYSEISCWFSRCCGALLRTVTAMNGGVVHRKDVLIQLQFHYFFSIWSWYVYWAFFGGLGDEDSDLSLDDYCWLDVLGMRLLHTCCTNWKICSRTSWYYLIKIALKIWVCWTCQFQMNIVIRFSKPQVACSTHAGGAITVRLLCH